MSIINLNKARKAKARDNKRAKAYENAVKFGRSKAQKTSDQATAERMKRHLDGVKKER